MEINIIAAVGKDGEIGKEGMLPWHIPADLRRFKSLTMGHPVIMGRKTWESLPRRPLPGRRNIVVSRDPSFSAPGAEIAHSSQEALSLASPDDVFVIGGAQIYAAFMPMATRLYLTEVDAKCSGADAFFPELPPSYRLTVEETGDLEHTDDGIRYRYRTYSVNTEKDNADAV